MPHVDRRVSGQSLSILKGKAKFLDLKPVTSRPFTDVE